MSQEHIFFMIQKSPLIYKKDIFHARLPQYENILSLGQANRTTKVDFLTILKTENVTGTHFFHNSEISFHSQKRYFSCKIINFLCKVTIT